MKRGGFGPRATPLVAHTGLVPKGRPKRRKPLDPGPPLPRTGRRDGKDSPQRERRREQLATWAEIKEQAAQRDGFRCVGCGTDRDLECQHRANKGMGGSRRLDTIANALTLCRSCHTWADQHKNTDGAARGWTVPAGVDPATWPIKAADGQLYLHTDDGERRRVG